MKKHKSGRNFILFLLAAVLIGMGMQEITVKAESTSYVVNSRGETEELTGEDSVGCVKADSLEAGEKNDLPKLAAPTGLVWSELDWNIAVAWDAVENAEGSYWVVLCKDGEEVGAFGCGFTGSACIAPIGYYIEEYGSGNYTVKVCAVGNDSYDYSDYTETSEPFVYVKPDTTLDTPAGIRWNGTRISWEEVENADGYCVELYCNGKTVSAVMGDSHSHNFSKRMTETGTYTVRVRALSKDINKISSSEYVEGPEFYFDTVVTNIKTELNGALETAKTDPEQAKSTLSQMNQDELKAAMQSDTEVKNLVKDIEGYYADSKNVSVAVSADTDTAVKMDAGKVSVVGAALNAAADNSRMELSFTKPVQDADVESSIYKNVVQMDISLSGTKDSSALEVPVHITMPVPQGVSSERLFILHYHQDGSRETIHPVINGDGTVSFTITRFSVFAFANERDNTPEQTEQVKAFVSRLYSLVLGRDADEGGLDSWTNALIEQSSSGVDAGYGFVFSEECKGRNLSDEDFVEMLYQTFMNRTSDEAGRNAWVSQLTAGVDREKVLEGFILSAEFVGICEQYGISVGSTDSVDAFADALAHYRNQNADLTKFVARCYTQALGRTYETEGLEAWCKAILTGSNTPKQVAQSFIFSDEFIGKNLSNEEYVRVLYRTFMGREADEGGLAAWVNVLESGTEDREKVLEGFSDSAEFDEILQSFGLN